jgi:hypothetical protein
MGEAIMQGNSAMEQMRQVLPPPVVSGATIGKAMIDRTAQIADAWEPLLAKIEFFTRIVDQIAEVRYAIEHKLVSNAILYLDPSLCQDGVVRLGCRSQGDNHTYCW